MKSDLWDYVTLSGLAAIAAGVAWIHPPSGLIFVGLALTAFGLYGSRAAAITAYLRRRRRPPSE